MPITPEHAERIATDMTDAQQLDFGAYTGHLAYYGETIGRMASTYPDPVMAARWLTSHADRVLDELNAS